MTETKVADWVGKPIKIAGTDETGIVLAVDDTPHRPSAWIKIHLDRDYPSYRSIDLADLVNTETGEDGPTWGTGGPEADMEQMRERRKRRGDASS